LTIRTFTARTMAQVLALVNKEVGKHAVVLHTRTIKRGGVMGLGARTMIEVTAADGREVARQRSRDAAQSARAKALRQASASRSNLAAPTPVEQQNAGDLIRRTYQAARSQFDTPATPLAASGPVVALATPPATLQQNQQMAGELRAVKELVEQVVAQQKKAETLAAVPPASDLPDPLVEHYANLIEQEIASELAHELVRDIAHAEADDVAEALRQKIAEMLPTDPDAGECKPTTDGRPRIIALVGPTGVGKTTTVAKLAATFKLKQNKRVGLITADTYRIAAVDQLRTYAGIIGLPLEVVSGPEELTAALARMWS